MKKSTPVHFLVFALLLPFIFLTSCKKTNNPTKQTGSTFTPPPQQNKVIYLDELLGPNTYTMWIANYDGSGATQINPALPAGITLAGFSTPKLSPDDKKIYFNAGANGTWNIYSCNLDGSGVQLLVSADADGIPAIEGAYYANQQSKILYSKIANIVSFLYTANADGTNKQPINLTLPGTDYIPSWSQIVPTTDGKTVFFTLLVSNGSYYIYSCGINGGTVTPVIDDPSGYQYNIGGTYSVQQQGKIVYGNFKGSTQIMTANLDGTGAQAISFTLPYPVYTDNIPPKVSPDGQKLFFNTVTTNGVDYGIYTCNIDGSGLQLITTPASRSHFFTIGQAF